ncbi:Helix-turn-helix domain protein [Microbacterium hydrocarbonoxydans]|uniref:Helix-turn-helix domain protein n=1 Tax=Microbacterium hydrocarbonoxydans TaxID=273678 RepID=A0A0M2HP39_9MICO|nr:helix-turn-helix domain-containing protein [Microbacterium hydrocarbonoxydans]KJL46236.1 Helix-turn-helix domain protein [Microbacterium hydrocarbonoxydans]
MTITATGEHALLTIDEVATELRRTPASVRWLIQDGQLKSGKLGGRRLIRRSDLNAWIEAAFAEAG